MEPKRIRVITPVTGEALGNAEFAHSEGQLADGPEQELLPDPSAGVRPLRQEEDTGHGHRP